MKKFIYILLLAVAVLYACDDDQFLTQESPDQLTTDIFFRDTADCEAAIASTYAMLSPYWYYTTEVYMTGDFYKSDCTQPGPDAISNYTEWVDMHKFNVKSNNNFIYYYWYYYYSGIMHANQIIDNLETKELDITDSFKKQIIGEARFLRAFFHYKLLTHWEKIVYRDSYVNSEEQLSLPLSDRIPTLEKIAI